MELFPVKQVVFCQTVRDMKHLRDRSTTNEDIKRVSIINPIISIITSIIERGGVLPRESKRMRLRINWSVL